MTISAQTLQLLIDAGLEGDELLRVVQSIEADNKPKERSANAIRQARYRDRKRLQSVTDNVTDNATSNVTSDVTESVTPRARVEDNNLPSKTSGEGKKKTAREEQEEFKSELRSILDEDRIQALVDVRRKKGGKINGHSARLLKAKILECGLTPEQAADTMALRNWISIERSWIERDLPQQRVTGPPPKDDYNSVLDSYINGSVNDPSQPSFGLRTSHSRPDRDSAQSVIQLHALPARR